MNWNQFYQALDAGDVKPVYLFSGPEVHIKNEALAHMRRTLLPEGLEELNESVLEGVNATQIIEAAETLPVMGDRRLVVVRDWAPLMSGKAKNEAEDVEHMVEWLKRPPETCALVFYMRADPDGKKKLTTLLRKQAECVSFDLLTDAELTRWVGQRLKPLKKRMSAAAVSQLALTAGHELSRLSGELEKLVAYVGERAEITARDIEAVVAPSLEYRVFTMLDRLLAGNIPEARALLKAALESGEAPIGILATFTRQFRTLTHIRLALDSGSSAASVEKLLKLNPRAMPVLTRQVRAFTADQLTRLYRELIDLDYSIKSGRIREREALDMAFLKIGLKK